MENCKLIHYISVFILTSSFHFSVCNLPAEVHYMYNATFEAIYISCIYKLIIISQKWCFKSLICTVLCYSAQVYRVSNEIYIWTAWISSQCYIISIIVLIWWNGTLIYVYTLFTCSCKILLRQNNLTIIMFVFVMNIESDAYFYISNSLSPI